MLPCVDLYLLHFLDRLKLIQSSLDVHECFESIVKFLTAFDILYITHMMISTENLYQLVIVFCRYVG